MSFNQDKADSMNKAMKGIVLLRKLQFILPCLSLLTINKSFIRPHLDYGDVIRDQPSDKSFLTHFMPLVPSYTPRKPTERPVA